MSRLGPAPAGVYSDDSSTLIALQGPNGKQYPVVPASALDYGSVTPSNIGALVSSRWSAASTGNSIAGLSGINAQSSAMNSFSLSPFWQANGLMTALHMLSGAAFDRARSHPINFGVQSGSAADEVLDHLGCYGYSGAILNTGSAGNMLNRKQAVLDAYIDKPQLVFCHNELENDIAMWSGTLAAGKLVIAAAIIRDVELWKQKFPNIVICYSCPNPSFFYLPDPSTLYAGWTSANGNNRNDSAVVAAASGASVTIYTNQLLYQFACAFIKGLPNLYSNIIVENNNSRLDPNNIGIPLQAYLTYVSSGVPDGIHPNMMGEILRAQFLIAQFPWLFQNKMIVPKLNYQSGQPTWQQKTAILNPNFVGDGSGAGTTNGTTRDQNYTPWALNCAQCTATANANPNGGIDVVITGYTSGYVQGTSGFLATMNSTSYPLNVNTTYMAVAEIIINNSTNIWNIELNSQSNPGINLAYANRHETAVGNYYTNQGISGMLPAGQQLILCTPPFIPAATDTNFEYYNLYVYIASGLPVSPSGNQMPAFTIKSFNIIPVDDVLPKVLTLPQAVAFTLGSGGASGTSSMVASATPTGVAMGQVLLSTAAANNSPGGGLALPEVVQSVAGTTINLQGRLTAQASGNYLAYAPYVNRTKYTQQIVITGSAVTPTYWLISGGMLQQLPAANQTIMLPPGAMFLANWASGTPVFTCSSVN